MGKNENFIKYYLYHKTIVLKLRIIFYFKIIFFKKIFFFKNENIVELLSKFSSTILVVFKIFILWNVGN